VLVSYATQHGFTLVLDFSQQQNPILYAMETTNITKPVIEAYNQKSGIPAPPAQPAAAPAAKPPVSK
jgi:outer membrane protein